MPTVPDGVAGATIYKKFTTRTAADVPTTLAGSPVVSIYKDGSTTESVAGVTLTVDFDGRTGLNHVAIDTSADGTFYANGSVFYLVVTTGTVASVSAVGEVVGSFSLALSDPWATLFPGSYSGLQAGALAAAAFLPDGTIAAATATTVTLPATDARGASVPDDGSYANTALWIQSGTGRLQTVVLDAITGTARQYTVVSGTMPVQLDATSQYVALGATGNAYDADGRIAAATATTVTLPATTLAGLPIADDGHCANQMLRIVAKTGMGQVPILTTPTGAARTYNLKSGSCPVPLDATSQFQFAGSVASELDLTQPVPTSNAAQTVGDALNAARADGFGPWAITGASPPYTITMYAADGTTVVHTFQIDSLTAPMRRY